MNGKKWLALAIAATTLLGATANISYAHEQRYAFERGYPIADTSKHARDDADLQRAITAYRFWYPTVSVEGIFNGNRASGVEDNAGFGIAATSPLQVGFTLNSDTPYGSTTIDVSKGPIVIELPPGAFIGLVDDHHQGWCWTWDCRGPMPVKPANI